MALSGFTYERLNEKLIATGETLTIESLKNKINRGDFSAKFLFLSLEIMQVDLGIHKK